MGFEPTTTAVSGLKEDVLRDFERFLLIDQMRKPKTVHGHVNSLRKFYNAVGKEPDAVTREDVRDVLANLSVHRRNHLLKALRIFYARFLGRKELLDGIRFGNCGIKPHVVPSKNDLYKFYESLDDLEEKALFLLIASSGLRKHEAIQLKLKDINFEKRMVIPNYDSETKRTWVSFYNCEAEKVLKRWLEKRNQRSERLFPMAHCKEARLFREAISKTGLHITLKTLRIWFCCEMANLGVQDRYVDAFCGRVPRSILARHYTDYSPERLKEIYDKTGLKVLA